MVEAGLARLSAAIHLQRAGLSYLVVEAREQVSGCACDQSMHDGQEGVRPGAVCINDTNQSVMSGLPRRFWHRVNTTKHQ